VIRDVVVADACSDVEVSDAMRACLRVRDLVMMCGEGGRLEGGVVGAAVDEEGRCSRRAAAAAALRVTTPTAVSRRARCPAVRLVRDGRCGIAQHEWQWSPCEDDTI
jgi:hypothetical protein